MSPARTVVVVFVLACAPVPAMADGVDDYVAARMRELHLPGLSIAVVRDGRTVKSRGYGLADLQSEAPATEDTVFEVGSLTKQFTAAAAMLLVEEGKLGLDERLATYLPGVPEAWRPIAIRHLLTHSSGVQNYLDVPGLLEETARPGLTHRDIAKLFFGRLRLEFREGETWCYSNSGYLLLGNVVEAASGRSYWEFLGERIFRPLGMSATRSSEPAAAIPRRASGYEWLGGKLEKRPALTENAYAAGSIVSTAPDLAKWDAALYSDKLLKVPSLRQVWAPARAAADATAPFNYGFGWFVDTYHGRRVVWHSGGTPGCSSLIFRFVDDRLTVIILTNHGDRVIDHLAVDVAGFYVPELARPKEAGQDPDPGTSQRLHKSLLDLLGGKANPAEFTPAMRTFLSTGTAKGLVQWVGADGGLTSFTFSEQERVGADRVLRYKTVLGDVTRWFSFTLTPTGEVAQVYWW